MDFRSSTRRSKRGIDLLPLIDVVFTLLIFLLISASFEKDKAIKVDLPKTSAHGSGERGPQSIEITVSRSGDYFLRSTGEKQAKRIQYHALQKTLLDHSKRDRNIHVSIRADKDVAHGKVVSVLDAVKAAGIQRASISTTVDTNPTK